MAVGRQNEAVDGTFVMPGAGLERLAEHLLAAGRCVVAPVARDGAVVYDAIETPGEIARGHRVDSRPGHYRLERKVASI